SGIGAAGAFHLYGCAFDFREDSLQLALNGRKSGLDLPAVIVGSVVRDGDANASHATEREPGFSMATPSLQRGHSPGFQLVTVSLARAMRGTPRSTWPPLRSMIDPAPTTFAPEASRSSITSRVLPPVVMTSSMTTTVSEGLTENPRRR